ncbi:hypothetical protein JKP88DRAFT_226371 [Tribonema minus]|uniref:MICOS complex subunit MIC10 n=1 Tax=Tribonema minus TaxID=303371 RepID=A0A835YM07_9STRA|nr:hypothetical protein JKP88DRAFT_226371 [Tribonema minus]
MSEAQSAAAPPKKVPSEMLISEQWDECLERTLINFGTGLLVGGLSAVVLTRSPGAKRALMGFGAGAGVGASWVHCSQAFERVAKK